MNPLFLITIKNPNRSSIIATGVKPTRRRGSKLYEKITKV
jgi:hypothetical protein